MKQAFGLAVAIVLAGCATAPKPHKQILGLWNCEAVSDGVSTRAAINYTPDGKAKADVTVGLSMAGAPVEVGASGEVAWSILKDGRVEETVTSLKVGSGKMDGKPVPLPLLAGMVQPLVDSSIVGQKTVSTAEFAGKTGLTLTDEQGVKTMCSRPKA